MCMPKKQAAAPAPVVAEPLIPANPPPAPTMQAAQVLELSPLTAAKGGDRSVSGRMALRVGKSKRPSEGVRRVQGPGGTVPIFKLPTTNAAAGDPNSVATTLGLATGGLQ